MEKIDTIKKELEKVNFITYIKKGKLDVFLIISKGVGMRSKKKLILFDKLKKKSKENNKSFWTGSKGTYLFIPTNSYEIKKPITKVYLNRTYLTGLFKTKSKDIFNGDIKEIDKKTYLRFKVLSPETIDIYKQVD